jgi:ubiquinone/menaquinone biosynthesis C-methylase UbiE
MAATQKAYKGIPMEGIVATWYTKNTGQDLRRFTETAALIAARVPRGSHVLEVAPGPGYLTIELARAGYTVSALDISQSFVRIARANTAKAGYRADIQQGNAAAMPFPGDSFDFVVCMAAFKNFADPVGALDEIHRVLKPGGQASIFDLRKDAALADIDGEIGKMRLSRWNAALTRFVFRFGLLRAAYTRKQLTEMVAASRFGRCDIAAQGIGLELRLAKAQRPTQNSKVL